MFGGLKTLDFTRSPISVAVANALSSLTGLTSLNLCSRSMTDGGVVALAGLTGLTFLELCRNDDITDTGVVALSPLTALTDLRLVGNEIVTDTGVMALAETTSLTSLDLRECCFVTDEGLTARWPQCLRSPTSDLNADPVYMAPATEYPPAYLAPAYPACGVRRLTSLTRLDLRSYYDWDLVEVRMGILLSLSALTSLTAIGYRGDFVDHLEEMVLLTQACEALPLTRLDLVSCHGLNDVEMSALGKLTALAQKPQPAKQLRDDAEGRLDEQSGG
jgi:hypothetical protein